MKNLSLLYSCFSMKDDCNNSEAHNAFQGNLLSANDCGILFFKTGREIVRLSSILKKDDIVKAYKAEYL